MNFAATPRNWMKIVMLATTIGVSGCAAPPSVAPLLRAAQKAIADEKELLDADLRRSLAHVDQGRASLEAAYEADLRQQAGGPTAQWVLDATRAYVAAREALVRHEAALSTERDRRSENLSLAQQATDRAVALLEQQDALLLSLTGYDAWRLRDWIIPRQ